jgi:hypothetical protein
MRIKRAAFLLLLLGLFPLFALEADIELPGQGEWKRIFNRPGIIKTDVSQEKGDDNIRWVDVYTDVHITTDIPMDKLRREILNFNNYPRIFKRNPGITVIREDEQVYLDMLVGGELMGVSLYANARVLVTELYNTPEEFVLAFSHVSDDGRVKDVYGRWFLKRIPGGGKEQFYIRYYASSKVIRKYPLQRMIMALCINSESRDLLIQFLKAARE